nr:hypothetical protein [Tanacetum cinerariifolium]GEX60723.1 hypothetical protein [Tanacetum cinerariifolium]
MLDQHRKELHEHFSQILSTIRKSETPEPEAPTFAITTRSGVNTQDPPFLAPSQSTFSNHTEGATEKVRPEDAEPSIIQEPAPRPSIFYQPYKSSNVPFPSGLKKQKKDDGDERLLSIFKQIHINLPFLEAIIHMPKGAKVLKDLLSHKEKLKKAAASVKLSEECSAIIQRSLPQKERDPGSFTLPCLIGPLEVKNALSDSGAIDFIVFKMDEDKLVSIILGQPFLVMTRAVIDVYEGKLSLRVREPIEPLEWKALENRLKPSSFEPPKLELKELLEHLEYAFLQENNQLSVVISSALSTAKKSRLLEGLAAVPSVLVTGVSQRRQHNPSGSGWIVGLIPNLNCLMTSSTS